MNAGTGHSVPRKMREKYETITEITDGFCREHLSRKRPSPLESGRTRSWAAGIVYALGRVNFLSDDSHEPYMRMTDLCERIRVSQSTASNKSREIWNKLDLMQLDPDWCLPSMLEDNLLAWMIEVNGLIVDARMMPREVQEEAYRLGLIPYVP